MDLLRFQSKRTDGRSGSENPYTTRNVLRALLTDTRLLRRGVENKFDKARKLASRGKYARLLDYLYSELTANSVYLPYLLWKEGSCSVEREIQGHRMILNLADKGLSYDLLVHGEREELVARQFKHEIRRLTEEVDRLGVLEVGANIGYYVLQEADILDGRGHIWAFEPIPESNSLLRENVALNGYSDVTTIEEMALGDENGETPMVVPDARNISQVLSEEQVQYQVEEEGIGSIETEIARLDDYLRENEGGVRGINVVRMDVEGYEASVLRGMADTLRENAPLVCFLEVHPISLRRNDAMDELVALLSEFEVLFATQQEKRIALDSVDELRDQPINTKVLLRKG